jgi:hypothetical protein
VNNWPDSVNNWRDSVNNWPASVNAATHPKGCGRDDCGCERLRAGGGRRHVRGLQQARWRLQTRPERIRRSAVPGGMRRRCFL